MTSLGWVVSLTDAAISIEKIPFPLSYSRTEDTAGATLPATLLNRCAPGVERVIGARLFADGAETISLRMGAARAPSVTAAPAAGDVHFSRGDSTIPNDARRKLTPRICAQTFPCSSHRS